ncbi:hypothetical protein F5884DRAFT_302448 [Xylogone sp. PMI_703]|nr:hypothetical protein F5884DRAFT_302448 [Xylogone sp. PMI_703]
MASKEETTTSDVLYNVKRTIIDYMTDPSGATQITDVLATFTLLPPAKEFAYKCLDKSGYKQDDFDVWEEKDKAQNWRYPDGVLVHAKGASGVEIYVAIDTTPNTNNFKGNASGLVETHLQYVVQTTIDYEADRSGERQSTSIEGVFGTRDAARKAAKSILLDKEDDVTKESFAEYDERDEKDAQWAYGENSWVHAVGANGVNYLVQVLTQPGTKGGTHSAQ